MCNVLGRGICICQYGYFTYACVSSQIFIEHYERCVQKRL